MDVYSFGLICMWLFFRDDNLAELGLPGPIDAIFTAKGIDSTMKFQAMKKNKNKLLSCALGLVEQKTAWEDDIKTAFKKLFELSLDADPSKRASIGELIERFWNEKNQGSIFLLTLFHQNTNFDYSSEIQTSTESVIPNIPNWHGTIQVRLCNPIGTSAMYLRSVDRKFLLSFRTC